MADAINPTERNGRPPRLPAVLAAPLALVPGAAHSRLLALALNRVLATPLREGELDFLEGRSVAIKARDADVGYRLTLNRGRLAAVTGNGDCDLSIEATVYDFLSLAGRQEDPDTLVFQRRLLVAGDTELGLALKNFLDSLDSESLDGYRLLQPWLQRALPVYRRVFGRRAAAPGSVASP